MKYIIMLFLLMFSSCSHNNFVYQNQNLKSEKNTFQKVDLKDLIINPDSYHNKYIEISGYFTANVNETALYKKKGSNNKGIWLSFKGDIQNSNGVYLLKDNNIDNYDDRVVIIRGLFDKKNKGNLSLYLGTLSNIVFFSSCTD